MAQSNQSPGQDLNQLLKIRHEKLEELQSNGKDPFQITKYEVTKHSQEIKDDYDTLEGQVVSVAGRMMFKRVMGKASFCIKGSKNMTWGIFLESGERYLRRRRGKYPFMHRR